jgi:hypothetical protein
MVLSRPKQADVLVAPELLKSELRLELLGPRDRTVVELGVPLVVKDDAQRD